MPSAPTKTVTATPFVTVLMTVYNGEMYLRPAVESVLSQEYADFEFLIVDDASTDRSLKILESYQDSRIRIIRNLANAGQTASLNVGLRGARGKYIARIDADDIALPYWLTRQVRLIHQRPDNAVISATAGVINYQGVVKQLLEIPQTHEMMLLRSLTSSPVNHGGSLMKREVILRYGGYNESFRVLADYDLWTRLLQGGEVFSSGKEVLMVVRFHPGSISKAEMERLVAQETKRVFRSHVLALTHRELSNRDLTLLWLLCYRVEAISLADMEEAVVLLRTIYQGLSSEMISKVDIMRHWKCRIKVFVVKKIFILLSCGDHEGVRTVCRSFERHCGRSSIVMFFRYLRLLEPLGKTIPLFFNFIRRQGASLILKRRKLE